MTETRDSRDIVDRLRHAPVVFGTEMFGAHELLETAASEIERLRSQRVAVPEGWCLVPSAPTDAMIHAGRCETSKINDDDDYTQAHVCYRAMLAASPQPPPAKDGWQDISTAPRDGTRILIAGGTYHYTGDTFRHEPDFLITDIAHFSDNDGGCWFSRFGSEYDEGYVHAPTHWMPLPAPPATAIRALAHGDSNDR